MLADLRLALRQLAKSPGFTVVAVLSLALGIGANTAVFSLVNDFLLRSLPVKNPEELVLFRYVAGAKGSNMSRSESGNSYTDPVSGLRTGTSFSLLTYERFYANHPALTDVFAFASFQQVNVLIDGQPETAVTAQFVSGDYYKGLGVPAALGRIITADDDRPSAASVAVISERYWQRRFGGDPAVLGRTIVLNKEPVTVIGVSARGFNGTAQAGETSDISVPLQHQTRFSGGNASLAQPWFWWMRIMGRVAPGFTTEQARASLEPIFQGAALEGWKGGQSMDKTPRPEPALPTLAADPGGQGETDTRRQYRQSLRVMLGLSGLVLLAACANVANLLLARSAARRREIAVRLALGAGRGRIIRQLLAESLLLAGLGAAAGIAFAWWGRDALVAMRPFGSGSLVLELPLDGRVLAFTTAAAAVTALLFGLAPALRATRVNLTAEFQGGTRSPAAGRSRLSSALMVLQIALSLVLLVSTALFVRTLNNLQNAEAGFNRERLVFFRIDGSPAGYSGDKAVALKFRLLERLQQIPGAGAATFSEVPLLNRGRWSSSITVPGFTPPPDFNMGVHMNALAPNFFSALELPLLLGRAFNDRDDMAAPKVAIVNQAFAQKFFNGENPVGRTFSFPRGDQGIVIVGLARDAKYASLRETPPATVYLPARQHGGTGANYAIRFTGDPGASAAMVRAAVREVDATLPVLNFRTLDEQLNRNHAQERMFARLSGFFGFLALTLACVGLYGLMSYNVLRRTGEIGVRMALGALPRQVMGLILRESLALVCLGVIAGLGAAFAASRLIATMLFGLSATDPATYGAVALLLVAIAVLAALLPARRAARTDPLVALRAE